MSPVSRRSVIVGLAASAVPLGRTSAQGQTLKIIHPYSAGGAPDAIVRLIAEHLQKSLGRAVIVENRVGAGGRIAARAAKDAPANGTELLFAAAGQVTLQPHLYRDLGYDPFVDFIPVSQTVKTDLALAVGNQVPARSIKELIAWFKENPTQAVYGSPGAGTFAHFAGIELAKISGLEPRKTVARLTDFRPGEVVVDVGGGSGELLSAVLAANPGVRGVLFDLPSVVKHAGCVLSASKVVEHCTVEGGSFFERIPGNGDTYLLKQVLHDWDDERAIVILRCCRQYMPLAAKLLIIERNLPEVADAHAATESFFIDLEMLVMTPGGRERTAREFSELLERSGFRLLRVVPTASPLSVFEARPG